MNTDTFVGRSQFRYNLDHVSAIIRHLRVCERDIPKVFRSVWEIQNHGWSSDQAPDVLDLIVNVNRAMFSMGDTPKMVWSAMHPDTLCQNQS